MCSYGIVISNVTQPFCSLLDSNIIELPRELFKDQESKSLASVWVEPISMPRTAEKISVDPLSWRDWELLEARSSLLEDILLRQITIVFPEQIVPLQISNGVIARVCVQKSGFTAYESIWEEDTGSPLCLCLKNNTSIIVSPKPRLSSRNPLLRLVPCMEDYNESMELFFKSVKGNIVHVPPFSAAVHPDTLNQIPGYSQQSTECNVRLQYDEKTRVARKETAVARIISSDKVALDGIGEFHLDLFRISYVSMTNNFMLILTHEV